MLPLQRRTAAFATSVMCLLSLGAACGATNLRLSANGHYIETADGTPFLYRNDAEWIIKMNRITAGSRVSVAWFDPRSGAVQPAGSYSTSQIVSLTPPPDWEDAVLCLTAVGGQIHVGQRPVGSN